MPSYQSTDARPGFDHFLNSFLQNDGLGFRDVLTDTQIEQCAAEENVSFGTGPNDIYSVPITLWAFVVQMVSEPKSCVAAVARIAVLLTVLNRPVPYAGTGAFCKARAKLPESLLRRLACEVADQLEAETPHTWRWHGHRVDLADGSTLSMPDTPANQEAYPQSRSQKPGVGFPILRWVALVSLATGAMRDSAFGPYRGKETGETALFRSLLDRLQPGQVVLADRYYCSYWMIALLQQRGVHVVFRQHQLRHTDFRRGRRLGHNDHVVTWSKPQRPSWMDQETYDALPETLTLREVRGVLEASGCRTEQLVAVTTFCDDEEYPAEDILELYHQRWHAEIDLRSIKTHMKMDVLRCKTPEMVRKEIWAHLLAYNLVRQVMAQAAKDAGVRPRQLSFTGAMQTLNEFRPLLLTASAAELIELGQRILTAIASHRVGNRPNRVEPRKVKRRPKGYSRLTRPRAEERAALMEA